MNLSSSPAPIDHSSGYSSNSSTSFVARSDAVKKSNSRAGCGGSSAFSMSSSRSQSPRKFPFDSDETYCSQIEERRMYADLKPVTTTAQTKNCRPNKSVKTNGNLVDLDLPDAEASSRPTTPIGQQVQSRPTARHHQIDHLKDNQNVVNQLVKTPVTCKGFPCSFPSCSVICSRKDHLKRHFNLMHRGARISCKYDGCEKLFRDRSDMKRHHNAMHVKQEFKCNVGGCKKLYRSENGLIKHKVTEHNISDSRRQEYKCEAQGCNRTFTHLHLLKGHMTCHNGEKHLTCPHCNKEFSYEHNLRRHKRSSCTGTAKKSSDQENAVFVCDKIECGKRFSDKRSLARHYKAAHLRLKFECIKCKSAFSYESGLSRHLKICTL